MGPKWLRVVVVVVVVDVVVARKTLEGDVVEASRHAALNLDQHEANEVLSMRNRLMECKILSQLQTSNKHKHINEQPQVHIILYICACVAATARNS